MLFLITIYQKQIEEYGEYNPYVEEDKKQQVENLKVESLDDLFDEPEEKKEEPKQEEFTELKIDSLDTLAPQNEAPMLPVEEKEDELDEDLQKELEAKFDELFGPLDDNN